MRVVSTAGSIIGEWLPVIVDGGVLRAWVDHKRLVASAAPTYPGQVLIAPGPSGLWVVVWHA